MRLGLRLLLGFFLIVGLAAFFVMRVFVNEVKPGVRQAMESTLVDTANVLAAMVADDLKHGRIAEGDFARNIAEARQRKLGAHVWQFTKQRIDYRITIADARGIVVYDSGGRDLGRDNSRWNDVYRTLRGEYGARSTPEVPGRWARKAPSGSPALMRAFPRLVRPISSSSRRVEAGEISSCRSSNCRNSSIPRGVAVSRGSVM